MTINAQSGTVEKSPFAEQYCVTFEVVFTTSQTAHFIGEEQYPRLARVIIDVGVAYGTDVAMVEEVVNAVGNEMYRDPKWRGKLTEVRHLSASSHLKSEITVRAWFQTRTFQNWGAEREFNRRLKHAFEKPESRFHFLSANSGSYVKSRLSPTTLGILNVAAI